MLTVKTLEKGIAPGQGEVVGWLSIEDRNIE
jgi:hypothetical protein